MIMETDFIKGPKKQIVQQKIIDKMRLFGDVEASASKNGIVAIEDQLKKLGLEDQLALQDDEYMDDISSDSEQG